MMNKIIKLFVANLLLATSVLAFDMSTISSWNIPEGEVAQIKIGANVAWPPVPYITDGLVSWWDGKWNNGIGLHSDSTTVWKDLIGGRDATLFGAYTWSNDTWNVNAFNSSGYAQWNGLDLPESQTWQFLIYPTNGDVGSRIIGESPTIVSPRLMGNNSNQVSIYYSYGISVNTVVPYYNWYQLHQHTITHEKDSSIVKYYLDGRLVVTWSGATTNSTGGQSYGRFANTSNGGNRGIDASYYGVRLYDRILSDDEIYQSYIKDCERFNLQQRYWTYAKDAWLWADLADDYTLYTNSGGTQFATEIGDIVLRNRSKTMSNANYNVVANMKRTEDGLVGTNIIENTGTTKGVRIESSEALYPANTPLDNIEFATIVVTKNERSDTFTSANQARIYLGNYSKFAYLYYSAASLYYTAMQSSSSGKRIYLPSRGYFGQDPVIYGIRIKSVNGEFNTKISVNGVVFIDESGTVPEDIINMFASNYKPSINFNTDYFGMSSDYCEWLVWDHIPENWDDIESQLIAKYNAKRTYEYDIPGWTKYYFKDESVSNRFITGATTQEFRENQDVVNIIVGTNAIAIGSYSLLDCNSLTNIVFPENGKLNRIYYWAFRYCTNLTSVVIPEPCAAINYSAFYGCSGLTNVVLPNTLTSLGQTVDDSANLGPFQHCTALPKIRLPDSLKVLGVATFGGCTNLIEVENTTQLTNICNRAFQNCTKLAEFHFGPNIETISTNAFTNCISLTNIYIDDLSNWCKIDIANKDASPFNYASNCYIDGELASRNLVIPDDVIESGRMSFAYSKCFDSVIIPDTMKYIGYGMFQQSKIKNLVIGNGVTNMENTTFYNCSLTNVVFGNSLENISAYSFQFNNSLTELIFPDSLKTIGKSAYASCTGLTNVEFGLNITTLGNNSFNKCTKLKTFKYYKRDNETVSEAETRIKNLVSGTGFDITDVEFICINALIN